MTIQTKIVNAVLLVVILFVTYVNFEFKRIYTEEMKISREQFLLSLDNMSTRFEKIADRIEGKKAIE